MMHYWPAHVFLAVLVFIIAGGCLMLRGIEIFLSKLSDDQHSFFSTGIAVIMFCSIGYAIFIRFGGV